MKKIIGYLEGTDSGILSELVIKGYETLPLGNGWDGHGKNVAYLSKADGVALIVGYLHKVVPTHGSNITAEDLLFPCKIHNIPFLLIYPRENRDAVKQLLGKAADYVTMVNPDEVLDKVVEIA